MEFRDDSWANLVFVSTLDERRHRKEIAEAWDIPKTKLYSGQVDREIKRLEQVKILDINDDGILANLESMPFRTEIENYFKTCREENLLEYSEDLVENIEDFSNTVAQDELRHVLLDIDVVRSFYNGRPRDAKSRPMKFFYFLGVELMDGLDGINVETDHNISSLTRAAERVKNDVGDIPLARSY